MFSDRDDILLKKESELFLYKFGKFYTDKIIAETDQLQKNYPNIETHNSLDSWFESYLKSFEINKNINTFQNERFSLKFYKWQRAAIIFFCVSFCFSAISILSEAEGYQIFDMLISDNSIYSQISFENKNDVIDAYDYSLVIPKTWTVYYFPRILPAGYYFFETMEGYESKYIIFTNELSEHLVFAQESLNISTKIDTENAIVEKIEVNGLKGIASSKEGITIVVWNDNINSFTLTGNIKLETLIKVAESLEYKK